MGMPLKPFSVDSKQTVNQQLDAALAHIKYAEGEFSAGETLLAEANAKIQEQVAVIGEKDKLIKSQAESITAKDAEIKAKSDEAATLRGNLEKSQADLAALQKKDKAAEVRAQEIVASIGIPPLPTTPKAGPTTVKNSEEDPIKNLHGREKLIECFRRERLANEGKK